MRFNYFCAAKRFKMFQHFLKNSKQRTYSRKCIPQRHRFDKNACNTSSLRENRRTWLNFSKHSSRKWGYVCPLYQSYLDHARLSSVIEHLSVGQNAQKRKCCTIFIKWTNFGRVSKRQSSTFHRLGCNFGRSKSLCWFYCKRGPVFSFLFDIGCTWL